MHDRQRSVVMVNNLMQTTKLKVVNRQVSKRNCIPIKQAPAIVKQVENYDGLVPAPLLVSSASE
jgi:hypothetical protein